MIPFLLSAASNNAIFYSLVRAVTSATRISRSLLYLVAGFVLGNSSKCAFVKSTLSSAIISITYYLSF